MNDLNGKSLTLNHLKRLTLDVFNADETSSFAPSLRLPLLETLELRHTLPREFIKVVPFCRNVSATLTTLIINTTSDVIYYDDLYQLCKLPFPKLRSLEFSSFFFETFPGVIHALALLDGENCNPEIRHLPALESIILRHNGHGNLRSLLDSLKEWRIGEAFDFRFQFQSNEWDDRWTPKLREELRSIVGRRRVEITSGGQKV
jgi:hypothetical protein